MDRAVRRVGLVYEEQYFWHRSMVDFGEDVEGDAQFETPEPRRRLLNLLQRRGLADACLRVRATPMADDDLLRVHAADYVARLRARDATGGEAGESAPFGPGSVAIACSAAGGVHAALAAVLDGHVEVSYALVRPPGHHAERDRGRGFCLLANVPIAIEKARAELSLRRVAIVDWDVHHGNGAQSLYYSDPNTLTISIHQDQLYPRDTGFVAEIGGPGAAGTNVNIPLPPGSGDGAYLEAWDRVVSPVVRDFAPDALVICCGFDASQFDPSGRMLLTAASFRHLTERALGLAQEVCGGRLVMAQEGGYSPMYVPICGATVVESLLGVTPTVDDPLGSLADLPYQAVQPHQRAVIDAALEAHTAAISSGAAG